MKCLHDHSLSFSCVSAVCALCWALCDACHCVYLRCGGRTECVSSRSAQLTVPSQPRSRPNTAAHQASGEATN